MTTEILYLYRVEDTRYAGGVNEFGDVIGQGPLGIALRRCKVRHVTPHGWRLETGKFVKREALKRWACPTPEEAFESFYARKSKQARIYMKRAEQALEALCGAKRLTDEMVTEMKTRPNHDWARVSRYTSWADGASVAPTYRSHLWANPKKCT